MNLDELVREADPARDLDIPIPDPRPIMTVAVAERRSRSLGRLGGGLAIVAGVAVAAVAVIAVSSIGQDRLAQKPNMAQTSGSVQAIVSRLAVLRRPQTAGDRLPRATIRQFEQSEHAAVVTRLTRQIANVDVHGTSVAIYLLVEHPHPNAGASGAARLQRQGAIVTTKPFITRTGEPFPLGAGREVLVAPSVAVTTGGSGSAAIGSPEDIESDFVDLAGVVPDGVTKVRWVFSGYNGYTAHPLPSLTVYPKISQNVAVAAPKAARGYLASATWYGDHGQVIASFNDTAQILAQAQAAASAIARSAKNPANPALARTYSVFRSPAPRPAVVKQPGEDLAAHIADHNSYGLNLTQARSIPYKNQTDLAAIPGSHGFAVLDENRTASGPATGSALSNGLILLLRTARRIETVVGLVPNGNPTVTVVVGGGRRWTVRTLNNAFVAHVTGLTKYVIEKNAAGRQIKLRAPAKPICGYSC